MTSHEINEHEDLHDLIIDLKARTRKFLHENKNATPDLIYFYSKQYVKQYMKREACSTELVFELMLHFCKPYLV